MNRSTIITGVIAVVMTGVAVVLALALIFARVPEKDNLVAAPTFITVTTTTEAGKGALKGLSLVCETQVNRRDLPTTPPRAGDVFREVCSTIKTPKEAA